MSTKIQEKAGMTEDSRTTGVIAWFVRNPVAANLLMLFLMVAGGVTAFHLKKESYPEFKTETVSVRIQYPGASPEDVEEGIIKKVEEALQGMEGIKKISAAANEGIANIEVGANTGVAMDEFLDEIRSRVNGIDTFPAEAEKPDISEEILKTGVMWLILHGNLDDRSLKRLSQGIKDDLSALSGISQVEIMGTRPFEISVDLSESSLRNFSFIIGI